MSKNKYEIVVMPYADSVEKTMKLQVYLGERRYACRVRQHGWNVVFTNDAWTNQEKAHKAALRLEASMWHEVYLPAKNRGSLAGYWVGEPEVRRAK